jgi:hypothetical protein
MHMENYPTKDLPLAAALFAIGRKFVGLSPNGDGRSFDFNFKDAPACEESARAFWSGSLRVNALEYANALRTLKDIVFSVRR